MESRYFAFAVATRIYTLESKSIQQHRAVYSNVKTPLFFMNLFLKKIIDQEREKLSTFV